MSAARPRSYISPLLLGLGVYVHRLFGSRQVVDLLSALGCSVSYHEVQRFEASAVMRSEESKQLDGDALIQYVYDNADHNAATLDGSGSFHVLGGIECTSPSTLVPKTSRIERLVNLPSAENLADKTRVKILRFCKTSHDMSCVLKDLKSLEKNENISVMLTLDSLWLFGYAISVNPVSSWNGYMQAGMEGSNCLPYHQTHVRALPFIDSSPSNPDTIYTALVDAERRSVECGQKYCYFTGDLPTYVKAREIVTHMQEKQIFMNVVVRLRGVHLLMNFLGAVGYIMSGSGIEELLSTIYARGSVDNMMNAKYYSRAIRGHFLIHAALGKLIFLRLDLQDVAENEVTALFKKFQSNQIDAIAAASDKTAIKLMQLLSKATTEISSYGPTAKLWTQYFELISLVKLFIRAERTGDWELHLSCIASMLPIFHAAGHLKYAKYAHVYVQDMMQLKYNMPKNEYARFSQGGFTVRRNEWYWSGCWTDLIIEQELMRSIKSSGGLTRGRGLTESTATQFLSSQPACLEIMALIENFSGKRAENSEQHKEMRDTRMARDKKDVDTLYKWLEIRNPFICSPDHLVSLTTGVVAENSVNCHILLGKLENR
ncbi:hypothetical protein B566_EDAN016852 [Ephemera danica]|nr:hypothetical protein B566_EDAN016852 [Ephemera danica]